MDQKPFRTFFLWMIWASAAIVIYLTLYRDTDLWSFLEHDPSRITGVILGLFCLGLIGSFVLTIIITLESYRAMQLDTVAKSGGLKAITIKSTKRVADRFFHAIQSTLESKGQPAVETLLGVELAAYERTSHTIEVLGNLLVTLGLIGTVMGLTLTLTGLTSSLEALGHDQELLLSGLRQAMSGMGTAFYTTLLGAVMGGVLLRMFSQITQHGVESLHDNLLRICLVYCSADYVQTTERDVRHLNDEVRVLEENIRRIEQALGNSQGAVASFRDEIKQLNNSTGSGDNDEPLHVLLEKHRQYCQLLRDEMRMLYAVNRPWTQRLKDVFRK